MFFFSKIQCEQNKFIVFKYIMYITLSIQINFPGYEKTFIMVLK